VPAFHFLVQADEPVELEVQLRRCSRLGSFTPDVTLAVKTIPCAPNGRLGNESGGGESEGAWQAVDFETTIDADQYLFVCLMAQPRVRVRLSDRRLTGILSLRHGANRAVAESATQTVEGDLGIDTLEFWLPERRPGGHNLAMRIEPPLPCFHPRQVVSGVDRPTTTPNAWVADPSDPRPTLSLCWDGAQSIGRVELVFDTDLDHPMESVQMGHPERTVPFCVRHFRILDGQGRVLHEGRDNHQTRCTVRLPEPVKTDALHVECLATWGDAPAAVFRVSCDEA
ncbi:MAG: FAD-binding dehydrogenase, partial [Patescibacteria group bacterium]|nr:FAD-binding dehydrogenase [Patescibacteria group bacterium]